MDANRIRTGGDELQAFAIDRFGEHGGGGGTVAGDVAGLARDFLHHLGADVFKRVFQFDFLGHGDTVLGDRGGTEFLVNDHIAAFRSESGDDGLGELGNAAQDGLAGGFIKQNLFSCHNIISVRSVKWGGLIIRGWRPDHRS